MSFFKSFLKTIYFRIGINMRLAAIVSIIAIMVMLFLLSFIEVPPDDYAPMDGFEQGEGK
jgi:hypothetical protein